MDGVTTDGTMAGITVVGHTIKVLIMELWLLMATVLTETPEVFHTVIVEVEELAQEFLLFMEIEGQGLEDTILQVRQLIIMLRHTQVHNLKVFR